MMETIATTIAVAALAAITVLSLQVKGLKAEVRNLQRDAVFGITTRSAFEGTVWKKYLPQWKVPMVFWDLDHMHELNEELGYMEVDRRIAAACQCGRVGDLLVRWYSGDEFVAIPQPRAIKGAEDLAVFAARIQQAFADQGIGCTVSYDMVPTHADVRESVRPLADKVQQMKSVGNRGGCLSV